MNLKIEYVKVGEINEYENNARRHEEHDVHAIAKSIEQFGFSDPIGVWGKANTIVEGHGRYLAALELGLDEVPVIRLDHLTDEERKAYALAHNKTAELSGWDFGKLEEELNDLEGIINMDSFGFADVANVEGYVDSFFEKGTEEAGKQTKFILKIEFDAEEEMEDAYERLKEEGWEVKK